MLNNPHDLEIWAGGQNGADRASLDAARYCGYTTGGWAARGFLTQSYSGQTTSDESLIHYGLKEFHTPGYPPRTKANVQDTDATVWFGDTGSRGGRLTLSTAERLGKPLLLNPSSAQLSQWLVSLQPSKVNFAGNRSSRHNPDIYFYTFRIVVEALQIFAGDPGRLPQAHILTPDYPGHS